MKKDEYYDFCLWILDANLNYVTGCCDKTINRRDYVGKYCTCCGKEIRVPYMSTVSITRENKYAN